MPKKITPKEGLKNIGKNFLKNENTTIFIVFIIVIVTIGIIQPRFFSSMNIKNVFTQVSITGVAALGMTFVMISGGIDLSVGWMIGFLGCAMAYLIAATNLPIFIIELV